MVLHMRFESQYISKPSSAKHQREMTKALHILENVNRSDLFLLSSFLKINAVIAGRMNCTFSASETRSSPPFTSTLWIYPCLDKNRKL